MEDSGFGAKIAGAAIAVLAIAIAVMAWFIYNGNETFEYEKSKLVSELQSVNAQLSEISDYSTASEPEKKKTTASAVSAGDEVARLQNSYRSTSGTDIEATANALGAMFSGDDSEYGRTPWPPSVPSVGKWFFATTLSSSADTIKCVWLLMDTDDDESRIMGYVLADYNVDSGLFCNVEKHVTSYGAGLVPPTGSVQQTAPSAASASASSASASSSSASSTASDASASASAASAQSEPAAGSSAASARSGEDGDR